MFAQNFIRHQVKQFKSYRVNRETEKNLIATMLKTILQAVGPTIKFCQS